LTFLRIASEHVNLRFDTWRAGAGLPEELSPHALRHSYVTHLAEDGYDGLFIQQQVGHAWGATTAVYTHVSSDYKDQVLCRALGRAYDTAEGGRAR
jgi:integrase/recombinase XerC